jgi:hypothetical protein
LNSGWKPAGKVNARNGRYDLVIWPKDDFNDLLDTWIPEWATGDGLRLDALRGLWEGRVSALGR